MDIKKYIRFVKELEKYTSMINKKNNYSNIAILCIGTENLAGDSLGPLVGNELKCIENEFVKVYGCINENVDFLNAKTIIEEIYLKYKSPYIITIDAALSNREHIGKIYLSDGYIKIGNALQKSICFYSNINIKCVVGEYSRFDNKKNILSLNNVRKEEIYKMAEIISYGIRKILKSSKIYV